MKIKEFFKNKKILFAAIALVLFVVFFLGNFYTRDAYAPTVYHANYFQALEQLHSGDVVEQKLIFREGDEGVSVVLGTYVTTLKGGHIDAELFDESGTKIGETTTDLTGQSDNYGAVIYFGKFDESVYGQMVTLRMTFQDIDDELVTLYGSITNLDQYEAIWNGEPIGWNITLDGVHTAVYVEYSDFRNFLVCIFGTIFAYIAIFKIQWKEIKPRETVEDAVNTVKANWKKIVLAIGMILVSALLGWLFEGKISAASEYANPYRAYAISLLLFVIAFAVVFRKYIWKYVHVYFVMLVMLIGAIYILGVPPVAMGYDEQLHYGNAAYISWGATDKISVSDYYLFSRYNQKAYWNIFLKDQREAWVEEVNIIDGQNIYMPHLASTGFTEVPFFITSIALYVFRILRLNFITRFLLGKFVNLFIYAGCFGLSMKLLQGRGKLLLAMIGLIPTNILLASSYGTDWWIIAMVVLGFSIFISELQKHDKISTGKFALSTAIICVGMLPKAVYFPLLFPMMLLKKDRYEESKKCRWITVIGAVVLVLSFILPMVISVNAGAVGGGGDIRGGSDVNAAGQVAFILGNFDVYMKVLFDYMKGYLNPDNAARFLTGTSYHGDGPYFTVCLLVLAIAAAMDNSDKPVFKGREPLAVLGNYIGNFGTVVLVITALYVGYTAVAAKKINGCQPRYLLPILYPFLYFVGENKMKTPDEVKCKAFIWGAVAMMIIFMLTVNEAYLIRY